MSSCFVGKLCFHFQVDYINSEARQILDFILPTEKKNIFLHCSVQFGAFPHSVRFAVQNSTVLSEFEEGGTLKEKFCYLILLAVTNLTFRTMYVLFLTN